MALDWSLIRFDDAEDLENIRERMRVRQRLIFYGAREFNDDAPRDDGGKWTNAGSGTPSKADQATSKKIGAAKDTKHSGNADAKPDLSDEEKEDDPIDLIVDAEIKEE